jgi:Fe-S oxidoreductase
MLQDLAAIGVDLVGLDPSMTLTYRSEYAGALDKGRLPSVLLVQEWLARHLDALPTLDDRAEYLLLPHCTERATAPDAVREWQTVFARCGLGLKILPSGCCGMAGHLGTRGGAPRHLGTHLRLELGPPRCAGRTDRTSTRRRVLMPFTGETHWTG